MKTMTSVAASNMPFCSSQWVGDKAAACGSVESAVRARAIHQDKNGEMNVRVTGGQAQSMRAVVRTSIAFSPELGQSLVLPAFGIEDELKVFASTCSWA